MKWKELFIIFGAIALLEFLFTGSEKLSIVEDLSLPSGVGNDIERIGNNKVLYKVPMSIYFVTEEGEIISKVIQAEGTTRGGTRESRQIKLDKKFLIGTEKIHLISEEQAKYGIKSLIDILENNNTVNDISKIAVTRDDTKKVLELKIVGYPSSADYIEGMIENISDYDFFTNKYSLKEAYITMGSNYRNTVFPYIELKKIGPQITGVAVFKGYKMVEKVDVDDARMLNILRYNNVKGIITTYGNSKESSSIYAKSKRKVKCYKIKGKYKFIINLNLSGNLVTNEIYKNLNTDPKAVNDFEDDLASSLKKDCNNFIEKMQREYKMDVIDLGWVGAAKYGRDKNWDDIVSKSEIIVNVKVRINRLGFGDY